MPTINWLAAIAAAVSAFILGGLWYSPALFGKAWAQASLVDLSKPGNPAATFGLYGLILGLWH